MQCFLYAIVFSSQQSILISLFMTNPFFSDDIGAPKISYPQVLVFSYHSYVILDLTVFFFWAGGVNTQE
jgi:hypothetical protein